MTQEEKKLLIDVLSEVDGGCSACVQSATIDCLFYGLLSEGDYSMLVSEIGSEAVNDIDEKYKTLKDYYAHKNTSKENVE